MTERCYSCEALAYWYREGMALEEATCRRHQPGTEQQEIRAVRPMLAVMLKLDGFSDREIADFLGYAHRNVVGQIRRKGQAPLKVAAILSALRDQCSETRT